MICGHWENAFSVRGFDDILDRTRFVADILRLHVTIILIFVCQG